MKVVSGVGIEDGQLKALVVSCRGGIFNPITEIKLSVSGKCFMDALKEKVDSLEAALERSEESGSFTVEEIYCRLPLELSRFKIVEDVILISPNIKKKITVKHINAAKRYIENVALDWDEVCIHNIVLDYNVDGRSYPVLPSNIEGSKLKLKVFLVYMDRKVLTGIEDVFDNVGRKLGGAVFAPIADISAGHARVPGGGGDVSRGAVNFGGESTLCSALTGNLISFDIFKFGENNLKQRVQDAFLFPPRICSEIVSRYVSFHDSLPDKEIVIKDGQDYVNISVDSLSAFIKDNISRELDGIGSFFKQRGVSFDISFLGDISRKKGFCEFMRALPAFSGFNLFHCSVPEGSLLGCVKYGMNKFLEKTPAGRRENWWRNFISVIKDYF